MRQKKAMSLTEIMVCLFILGIISVPLYFLLSDSNKKANIALARDNIKQESTKAFKLLENDFTQARKGTFEQKENGAVIKVRKNEKKDMELKYTFDKPTLRREVDGKSWVVSNQVEDMRIAKALDGHGKVVVDLLMKANHVGLLDEEQPTYEQQKLIVMIEDATEPNDPFWREVGDMSKFFQTQGSLLAGLKEDASQMFQNFSDTWAGALGDIKNMTIGQLKDVVQNLKKNLEDVKGNLAGLNKDILDLDWEAMYEKKWYGFISNGKKEKSAKEVKEKIAGLTSLQDMARNPFDSIRKSARKGMRIDAIKGMYDAKKQLFEARKNLREQLDKIKNEAPGDVGVGDIAKDLLGND